MTPKIGVILFPGTNCELEALRALERSDMQPQLIRWNDTETNYGIFDGFFIPGGFSYEDRGRSGIIASKNPLLKKIKEEEAKGKPVLGVCNGAQILLEAKLIPGLDPEHVEMSLAWNKRTDKEGNILGTGFYNDWIYIRTNITPGRCAFNNFAQNHILRIPVAHAEGRFTSLDRELVDLLEKNEQTAFQYCDKNGEIINEFPTNPNGAVLNLAGVCNPEGNVMSLMPHPERTEKGQAVFDSMRDYIGKTFSITKKDNIVLSRKSKVKDEIKSYEHPNIEIFVDTVITDNEERTIEKAIHDMGFNDLRLKKLDYFGVYADKSANLEEITQALINSGEIVNLAKEVPHIVINSSENYTFDKKYGLEKTDKAQQNKGIRFLAFEKENTIGESIMQTIKQHFSIEGINKITYGKQWNLQINPDKAEEIVKTQIFHNPHAMDIFKA